MILVITGDSLPYLRKCPDRYFTAACFSPPYGAGGSSVFDVRRDFRSGGAFFPWALELSRTCLVWAANFTQLTHNGHDVPFMEELTLGLRAEGVELFDRWVTVKPAPKPYRGNRALADFEFVLLYSRWPLSLALEHPRARTVIQAPFHYRHQGLRKVDKMQPYSPEIPRQVFQCYGGAGPVLDPFAGSGTSLIEARELGLPAVGVELDPVIAQHCRERMGL